MEGQRPEGGSLAGAGEGGEAGGNRAPVLLSPMEGPSVTKVVSRPLVWLLGARSLAAVCGTTQSPLGLVAGTRGRL